MAKNVIVNAAVMGPKGNGKTTFVEALLFQAGAIPKMGTIEGKNTQMDSDAEEQERRMTIMPNVASFTSHETHFHFVDTAGYPDFNPETRAILGCLDNAVFLVSGVSGLKSQAIKLWNYAEDANVGRFAFINEMDKPTADFEMAFESLKKGIQSATPVPINVPIRENGRLTGYVDLLTMKAYKANADGSAAKVEREIPEDHQKLAEDFRKIMVEAVAESDDGLMERYFAGETLGEEEVERALHQGVKSLALTPVLAGSAAAGVGTALLLDHFAGLAKRPDERAEPWKGTDKDGAEAERKPHPAEPFSAVVIKTTVDQYIGKISYCRIISGTLRPESQVLNSTRGRKERINQILMIRGKEQAHLDAALPGDVVALLKLVETKTGDTLCDPAAPFQVLPLQFPEPVISLAIAPKERSDEDKLGVALHKLIEEDPLLKVERNEQTQQLTVSGMGMLQLEAIIARMKRRFGVDVNVSPPQVPYRETITKPVKVQGRHKKQSGGRGQFADIWLELSPLPRGEGFLFENKIFGGSVPRNYIPAVEKGVIARMKKGAVAGYPIVDMKATIYDGSYHSVDSSDMAFQIAGQLAIKKGVPEAGPVLLEPVMHVEVEIPEECLGDVIGDLNGRRGKVLEMQDGRGVKIIVAEVPQAEMLNYAQDLKSFTAGRGVYTMSLHHFSEVPRKMADDIVAKYQTGEEEED